MLPVQQPTYRPDPTLPPPHPGPRMNRALAVALTLAALGGDFAGIMIYHAHQAPVMSVSSACPGDLSRAQVTAIQQSGVDLGLLSTVPQNAPMPILSGDAALHASKAGLDPSAAAARCVVEVLVTVSATDPNRWVDAPYGGPAWIVILHGVGQESATPSVGSVAPDVPTVEPYVPTVPSPVRPHASALNDLVAFVDAYSGTVEDSFSIPPSTEQ